jgi:profilin
MMEHIWLSFFFSFSRPAAKPLSPKKDTDRQEADRISANRKKMSWQSYVDDQLIGSKCVQHAAIISIDGSSVWAKSAGFTLKPGEAATLANNFKTPSDPLAKGVFYGGVKYMCIRADANAVYGKKGNTGIVCAKTKKCVVVGVSKKKELHQCIRHTLSTVSFFKNFQIFEFFKKIIIS